jgi:hypothetical protein
LHNQSNIAEGKRSAARSVAGANLLKCGEGYGENSKLWTKDSITPTRLGQEMTLYRLGKFEAGRIAPYAFWRAVNAGCEKVSFQPK